MEENRKGELATLQIMTYFFYLSLALACTKASEIKRISALGGKSPTCCFSLSISISQRALY